MNICGSLLFSLGDVFLGGINFWQFKITYTIYWETIVCNSSQYSYDMKQERKQNFSNLIDGHVKEKENCQMQL